MRRVQHHTLFETFGVVNVFADALSRLQVRKFFEDCPDAHAHPTSIPSPAWEFFTTI